MTEFLTEQDLRDRIRKVMAGSRPRMCVAFLGPDWVEEVFEGKLPKDAQVICDLRMGFTVRAALQAGGAPNNERLRYLPDTEMHAKVYLSDDGAVVCSANATNAALSGRCRIEDGIWVKAGGATHKKICKQFEERYEAAEQVNNSALDRAPVCFGRPNLAEGLTLVEALRSDPIAFQSVYFVCSTDVVVPEIRTAANRRLDEEDGQSDPQWEVGRPGSRDYFSNWNIAPTDWPALFFSVHRGPQGGFYLSKHDSPRFFKDVQAIGRSDREDVFVSRKLDWRAAGPAFGGLPQLAGHGKCRDELRAMFLTEDSFEPFEGEILTGPEFADRLFQTRIRTSG
ncbi:hypothetical protein [Puniceibacterium sp. IMCC21224]|uniref:hypothetical protein n=1 Tax=Puniceibacterium sp. IMCC21224 TaxID=1618204 RepID=UPI00064D8A96|nr:hypothetical protein [Puniceibacterium sp. IMCC21224]KMK68183.1 hypothetical protein IMCC21224_113063 [Puniceibacterium sp. IMCC21224]